MGEQMETMLIDVMGTSSDSSVVQFVLPRLRGMLSRLIMIFQALWLEDLTKLATLEAKVGHMEGGMKPWLDI